MKVKNKNAPLARSVVMQFKPVGTGGADQNANCASCGYRSYGKPLCIKCWSGGMAYRHNRAALHFMRIGACS